MSNSAMNPEYQRLAYERTILSALRQHIEDTYLAQGDEESKELICELVPFNQRQVPNESFQQVIQRLQEEEATISREMAQFEFRRRDARPLAQSSRSKPVGKGRKPGAKSGSPG